MYKSEKLKREAGMPYYSVHKVIDYTCPYCDGRLSFIINDDKGAQHICRCGTWYRVVEWSEPMKEVWIYEQPKTAAEAEPQAGGALGA